MHMPMTKVISLSDKAYDQLKGLKEGNDSFSDVVIKLTQKKLLKEGGWKNMPEMDDIFKDILDKRHTAHWRTK